MSTSKNIVIVMILLLLSAIFPSVALAQSGNEEYCADLEVWQEVDRRLQQLDIYKDILSAKDSQINNLNQEIELHKKIEAIKDLEIQATARAFDQMKEVTDRAMKLAEISKPKIDLKPWAIIVGLLAVLAISL